VFSPLLPTCWTTEQWQKFKCDNDWLFFSDFHLRCLVCKSVSCLGPNRQLPGMKTKLSHEWINGCVGPNENDKHARQRSLRKKSLSTTNLQVTKKLKKCQPKKGQRI